MTEDIHIRFARQEDAETIARFNTAMARETEELVLDPLTIGAGVRALFENPAHGFYIVAEVDGETAACLMITKEWSDWRNGLFWWIQSVYVAPAYRRRGIYRRMYAFIKSQAAQKENVCGFRLYVEKSNQNAQQTYRSLGMQATRYQMFEEIIES